jgi:ATP-dependent Clp protease ATP-binding subunit ClpA
MRYAAGFERLLTYAAYDCAQAGGTAVEVDHLLLGLFREDFPLVDEVLQSFRVDSLQLLERLLQRHPEAARPTAPDQVTLGTEALGAIALGEEEAERLGHGVLTSAHTFVGILEHRRHELGQVFVRDAVVRGREEQVLAQVRQLVHWLRFSAAARTERGLDVIDADTVAGWEAVSVRPLGKRQRQAFAVQLHLFKRLRGR